MSGAEVRRAVEAVPPDAADALGRVLRRVLDGVAPTVRGAG